MTVPDSRRLALASALLLPLLGAAPSAGELTRTGGILGTSVTYDLEGSPFTLFALAPSFSMGPTPLAFFDPTDPRLLGVGIDLLDFWSLGSLDVNGDAQVTYPLPNSPSLVGFPLFAQFVEVPLFPTTFGPISNRTGVTLGLPLTNFYAIGNNFSATFGHEVTLLDDGRVLQSGGYDDTFPGDVTGQLAIYDPQTEEVTLQPGQMFDRRVLHTATKMADGRVFLCGGANDSATPHKTSDIFDPATGLTSPVPDMVIARAGHTATLLADGRIFVCGGIMMINSTSPLDNLNNLTDTTEIYDPNTNTWSMGPTLPRPRLGQFATLIPQFNWVMIAGGLEIGSLFGAPVAVISADCQRYVPDPTGVSPGFFTATASMNTGRFVPGGIVLDNNNILVAGGGDLDIDILAGSADILPKSEVEIYDIIQDTWTPAGNMNVARTWPDIVRTASGDIVAIGGMTIGDFLTLVLSDANYGIRDIETTDQSAAAWAVTGQMILQRFTGGSSIAVDGGTRIVTASEGDNGSEQKDMSIEIYIPQ